MSLEHDLAYLAAVAESAQSTADPAEDYGAGVVHGIWLGIRLERRGKADSFYQAYERVRAFAKLELPRGVQPN